MRVTKVEIGLGMVVLLVCVGIIAVVVPVVLRDTLTIWPGLWAVLGVAYLVALLVTALTRPKGPVAFLGLVGQLASVSVMMMVAPGAGWLPFLLIVAASTSAYAATGRVTAVVVLVSVGIVLVTGLRSGSLGQAALGAGMYGLLLGISALTGMTLVRERRLREELSAAHLELRTVALLREETSRSAERLRISRELHDVLGHQLTVLSLELEAATHTAGEQSAGHVARARSVARELLADVRATVSEMRRRAPDLRELLAEVAQALPQPRIDLVVADDVTADEEQTMALVRVLQEVATNTVRHGQASVLRVGVTTDVDGDRRSIVLHAADDGTGAADVRPGNGLRGIIERVEALGGSVSISGADGFVVTARLPLFGHPAAPREEDPDRWSPGQAGDEASAGSAGRAGSAEPAGAAS